MEGPSSKSSIPPGRTLGGERERNDTIELFRILAACGIVWFHMESVPWRRVGFAGLVFFLAVAVVFQARGDQRGGWRAFLSKRGSRLLVPWCAWFVVYGGINLMTGKEFFPNTEGFLRNLMGGTWIGLWYLPYAFATACLVHGLAGLLPPRPVTGFSCCAALTLIALLVVARIRSSAAPVLVPWAQWLQAAPSIPFGLALACALWHPRALAMVAGLNAGLLLVCACLLPTDPGMALSYGIGGVFASAGFLFKRRLAPVVGKVSALCLGVYLVHGVVMGGLKQVPGVSAHYLVWFVLTVIVSFGAIAALRRIPLLARWV